MEEPDDKRRTTGTLEDDAAGLIGIDVGGYVVESELGRGGMGVVYAATHPMIGKRAAIKILKHSLSRNPATVERFLQEARSVNQIGHPNIVDIFAFGQLPDGRSYLVMDLLQGEPLRKRVKRSAVPVGEAVHVLDEIASALVAAHEKGFIHRDLKPDNVFLVANPTRVEVKLLDFGLAKLMPNSFIESDRAYRTATGAMIGTPDYMSPEQLRGAGVDHRTDIYALGVMAFEMLTRSRPHRFSDGTYDLEGLTFKQALVAVPGVPEELADLVESMVERDANSRPTLVAVRAVLKRVRPLLQSPALGGVRAVGSEMSLGAFGPSNLGAKPMVTTPPTGSPTVSHSVPSHAIPRGTTVPTAPDSAPPYPLAAHSQSSMPPQSPHHVDGKETAPAMWAQPLPSSAMAAQQPAPNQPVTQRSPSWVGIPIPEPSSPGIRPPPVQSSPGIPLPAGQPPGMQPPSQAYPPPNAPSQGMRPPPQPSSPPPMASPALRSAGSPLLATKLGVAPAPAHPSRPHPVTAARRKESRTWLFVGLALVVVSVIVLVVVLAR